MIVVSCNSKIFLIIQNDCATFCEGERSFGHNMAFGRNELIMAFGQNKLVELNGLIGFVGLFGLVQFGLGLSIRINCLVGFLYSGLIVASERRLQNIS